MNHINYSVMQANYTTVVATRHDIRNQAPGFQDIVLVIAGLLGDHTRTKLGLRALGEGFVPNRIKFVMNICIFAHLLNPKPKLW